jgi:hypothetical protein
MDNARNGKMSRQIYNIKEYNIKVETEKPLVVVHYIKTNNTQKEQFHPKNERTNKLIQNL